MQKSRKVKKIKSNSNIKKNTFFGNSKGTDQKVLFFGSKRVLLASFLVIILAIAGGAAILQKSRDSSAAVSAIWDASFDNGANTKWTGFTSDATKEYRSIGTRFSGKKDVYVKTSSSGQRAEFNSGGETFEGHGVPEGSQAAHAFSMKFPTEDCGARPNSHFYVIYQEKNKISNTGTGPSSGLSPQRALDWLSDGLYIQVRGGDIAKDSRGITQGKLVLKPERGVWYDFIIDAKYDRSNGWVDTYVKRSDQTSFTKIDRISGGTMYVDTNRTGKEINPPTFQRIGVYRKSGLSAPSCLETTGPVRYNNYPDALSRFGGATTPTPTPGPTPAPSPTPSPTPTPGPTPAPSPAGGLGSNKWSDWKFTEAVTNGTVSVPFTKSQSGRLLVQFDGGKIGYKANQYGRYCITRSASDPKPKSITFTASYNTKTGNILYFYADDANNKLWEINDTGGVTKTNTHTINLSTQARYCFGNVTKSGLNSYKFGANRFINVTDYKFNY